MLNTFLIVALLGLTIGGFAGMTQKLDTAVADLIAETADTQGKLESIKTFVQGVPALVGAAVADALANADVDDDAAADAIDAARTTISNSVDDALEAIRAKPAAGDGGGNATDLPAETDETAAAGEGGGGAAEEQPGT